MNQTLAYYQNEGESFFQQTAFLNMEPLYKPFLDLVKKGGSILDFGCGSGRDAACFQKLGYQTHAIDGSEKMCRLARQFFGIHARKVLFQDFDETDQYDGIWACSSLLHVEKNDLEGILLRMIKALKTQGILYASFKLGEFDGMRDGRHFSDFDEKSLSALLEGLEGIRIEKMWISKDVRKDQKKQDFINVLVRKV